MSDDRLFHSPSEANRAGYDRWAQVYDGYVNSTVAVDDINFPPLWGHVHGANVLEIGCGTGRHTLRLARQGNHITALDLSPGMLAMARAKLAAFDTVRLMESDFMDGELGFVDFDVVVSALVLEHISDLDAFFERAAMALKSGGALYLSEIHPDRIAGGTQANFVDPQNGEAVRLTSFAHKADDIRDAAAFAGLHQTTEADITGTQALVDINPDWARHLGKPLLRMWTFEKV